MEHEVFILRDGISTGWVKDSDNNDQLQQPSRGNAVRRAERLPRHGERTGSHNKLMVLTFAPRVALHNLQHFFLEVVVLSGAMHRKGKNA